MPGFVPASTVPHIPPDRFVTRATGRGKVCSSLTSAVLLRWQEPRAASATPVTLGSCQRRNTGG
jgi:hypothetical protein